MCRALVPVHPSLHSHHLSSLLHVYCPCWHSDRSQLFDATFSPCNPSLHNTMIVRSLLPCRHFSFSVLRIVQVRLLRLPVFQTTPCGPLFGVLGVRHALLSVDTPERLRITSRAISDAVLNTIGMHDAGCYNLATSPGLKVSALIPLLMTNTRATSLVGLRA